MNNKIRVLISDDNNEFANTLSSFLEKDSAIQIMGIVYKIKTEKKVNAGGTNV